MQFRETSLNSILSLRCAFKRNSMGTRRNPERLALASLSPVKKTHTDNRPHPTHHTDADKLRRVSANAARRSPHEFTAWIPAQGLRTEPSRLLVMKLGSGVSQTSTQRGLKPEKSSIRDSHHLGRSADYGARTSYPVRACWLFVVVIPTRQHHTLSQIIVLGDDGCCSSQVGVDQGKSSLFDVWPPLLP